MSNLNDLKPTSLVGVKRLAKQLANRDGLKHSAALEAAAKQAGFPTFDACRRALAAPAGG